MARVFLSYRRADGQYAVGWIAERLRRLDSVSHVETAFRDADLLCGDDFPAALARQVEECDVLIAAIGPEWHGARDKGPARILDPEDWVGREITSAMANEKLILPILINGAEPLDPDDLLPEHRSLPDRHAIRFNNEVDLEEFVQDLEAQLDKIDAERAKTAGLDKPIELARLHPGVLALALITIAAVAFGVVRALINTEPAVSDRQFDQLAWIHVAFGAGAAAFLAFHARQVLRPLAKVRWLPVLLTMAVAVGIPLWLSVVYDDLLSDGEAVWNVVAILLMAPIIVPAAYVALGLGWLTPQIRQQEYGSRARLIAEHNRALVMAAVLMSTWGTLAVLTPDRLDDGLMYTTMGGVTTIVIVGSVVWGRTRLERESVALERDIKDLVEPYHGHASKRLVTEPLTSDEQWLIAIMLMPLVTGIIRSIIGN